MANYTSNYKLTKPIPTELYSIDVHNNNMDIVDTNLKAVSDKANEADTRSKTNESNLEALKHFKEEPFEETGAIVQVDLFQDAPLNVISHIEPIQEGSGDPYPAGSGKNLLSNDITSGNSTGITYIVNPDKSVTLNGTATERTRIPTFGFTDILPAGDYILSIGNALLNGMQIIVDERTETEWISAPTSLNPGYSKVTITKTRADTLYGVYLIINSGITVTNFTVYPQLEEGKVTTEYTPYSNIRPIGGRTEAKLVRCGKNLIPFATVGSTYSNNGMTAIVTDDGIVINGTPDVPYVAVVAADIRLSAGTYTITGSGARIAAQLTIGRADGTVEYISNRTFEIYGNERSIVVAIQPDDSLTAINNQLVKAQLEVGSAVTDFEPYQGDTFSHDFGQTVYGGSLDWNTGALTVDSAMLTLTGTETDIKTNTTMDSNRFRFKLPIHDAVRVEASSIVSNVKCSHYTTTTATDSWYNDIFGISQQGNTSEIYISDARYSTGDLDGFKQYLAEQYAAGTPVQVYYKRVEPITIQLTPQQIAALAGLNTLYGDSGDIIVSGRKDIIWLTHSLIKRIEALEAHVAGL
jgi:hypothetical protein